jgi:multidrug efflux pump subunit AcrA (membrane-fusion protein)/YHS domain-containing protein
MRNLLAAILFLALLSGSFFAGSWYTQREAVKGKSENKSDAQVAANEEASLAPGTVRIIPEKQQIIGVRIGQVEKAPQQYALRTLGRVAADETRVYRINAAVDGWIRKTFDNATGSLVKKDEILASFYSPDFLGAQQAYIFAVGSLGRYQSTGKETSGQISLTRANIQQYKDSLRTLGMGDRQIEEVGRTRLYTENIHITAPVNGFLLARSISPGERFDKGKELYRIADLSRVWILADLFEKEAPDLLPGTEVRVSLPYKRKVFQATVTNVLPLFDGASRTVKVRMEADNTGYFLRPDMFVDIELPVELPAAITVPVDAVLDSGLKKTVFVDRGNGFFEPREVETGWRHGNLVEIVKGLEPGEKIAISGNFLIDSESRLEMAAAGMYGTLSKDPVCGVDVSVNKAEKAGRKSAFRGKTYYFSSEDCKTQFDKNPDLYAKQ